MPRFLRRDTDAGAVPTSRLEFHGLRRFVLRRIHAVDARQANHRPAPAAENQRAERVRDREGDAGEKVASFDPHRLQRDLVIRRRQFRPGPRDAGQRSTGAEDDLAILDLDAAFAAELRRLPVREGLAVEERLPPWLGRVAAPAPAPRCRRCANTNSHIPAARTAERERAPRSRNVIVVILPASVRLAWIACPRTPHPSKLARARELLVELRAPGNGRGYRRCGIIRGIDGSRQSDRARTSRGRQQPHSTFQKTVSGHHGDERRIEQD